MGRPPIGKRAMSGAERQRKYLDRLLRTAKDQSRVDVKVAALKQQVATANREIKRLKGQLATAQSKTQSQEPSQSGEQVTKLQQQLKAAQTRNRNLSVQNKTALDARDRARTALLDAEQVLTYGGRRIRAAFHPDKELDAPPEHKAWLNEATQTVYALCEQMERQIEKLRVWL